MKVRHRHSSKKSNLPKVLLAVGIFLIIGLLLPVIFTSVSRTIVQPFYATHTWLRESSATLPTYLRDKKELLDEVEDLKSKLATASASGVTQSRLYEENLWLRELLGAEPNSRIAAAVIARPNQLPYDFLQIDQGSENSIVLGAPVYVGADNVIGIVAHVGNKFSFVELFTTPGFEATAFVSGANIIATVEGYGGGVARVKVPQGVALTVGSVVHVPSIQPGVFGRIAYIENEPTQPEQYGYITLDKPINSLHYVAVGREPLTPGTADSINSEIESIVAALKIEGINTIITDGEVPTTTASSSEVEGN